MKQTLVTAVAKLLAAAVLLTPVMSMAGTEASPAAGIKTTAHDFTSTANDPMGTNTVAVGVCTYCHTPHKAQSTLLLWNHTLSTNNFSWDVAKTTAGTDFPTIAGGTYKGPTAKCLSCHDGSVAIGDIAWFKGAAMNGANANNTFKIGTDDTTALITKSQGSNDMSGNHPVAMPYPFGQAANTYNGKTTGAKATLTEWVSDPSTLAQANIRLFNDDGSGAISAGAVAAKTGIECSSCHDPHNKATKDIKFLRGKITGSDQTDGYLCLQCHIK